MGSTHRKREQFMGRPPYGGVPGGRTTPQAANKAQQECAAQCPRGASCLPLPFTELTGEEGLHPVLQVSA